MSFSGRLVSVYEPQLPTMPPLSVHETCYGVWGRLATLAVVSYYLSSTTYTVPVLLNPRGGGRINLHGDDALFLPS